MPPFVSIEHARNGNNFQRDWRSIANWHEAMKRDSMVLWSHLFVAESGQLVASHPN